MSKVLVTGGVGTLGRHLVRALREAGHDVWQCDLQHSREPQFIRADIANYRQLQRVFEHDYDYVYHFAAEFGRINGEEYYDTLWQTNVIGTRNILEFQRQKGFRLIFASSSEIYGNIQEPILDENIPLCRPVTQQNDYALTKWVNEVQIVNFERQFGSQCMRLRLFNAYGPGEHYHHYRSIVCLFVYRALFDLPYQVYDGYHRVFMYIGDLIPTLARACERFTAGAVYNVGGVEYRSVRELSSLILGHLGKSDALVEYLPKSQHGVENVRPSIEKARQALGHDAPTTLEEGVPITIDWMRRAYQSHAG